MKVLGKTIMVGALLATASVAAVAPAEARIGTGGAVALGILGVGLGAAIASDHPHYYQPAAYYAPPPPPPPVAYYAPPPPPAYGYEYVQRCRVMNQWDGYYGRYVQTRRCW